MSAGALTATLAVAFIGGGLGATLGPWLTHRFGRAQRDAAAKRAPYNEILRAARKLKDISGQKTLADEEDSREILAAAAALKRSVEDADAVSSPEVRALADSLLHACLLLTATNKMPAPSIEAVHEILGWSHEFLTNHTSVQSAYDALRDQVQRETRG